MAPYIAPDWLEIEKSFGGSRITLNGSIGQYRERGEMLRSVSRPDFVPSDGEGLKTSDTAIGVLRARTYVPREVQSKALPVGVYGHSGGFCEGDLDSEDALCRLVAYSCPCIVVSIEYRKAPVNKPPIPFQDFLDGFLWAYDSAETLGGDRSKVFAFGCSAGGSLALATAHRLVEMGKGDVMKGVANCAGGTVHEQGVPPRLKDMYKAMEENSVGVPIIDRQTTQIINDVAGLNEYSSDPWMFPLLSENLGKFPPTYLVACGADPLRDDNIILASELQRLGVKTKIDVYDGMPHLFWTFARFPPFQVFLSNLVGGIQFILSD